MSIATTVVLGKRKTRPSENAFSLRLSSSPAFDAQTESEYETEVSHDGPSTSSAPALAQPRRRKSREKRYTCDHKGCTKSYTKPCRLEEHKRSHTGDRPFVCSTCNKSYLRDTHLQAHARSHLPASARPLGCDEPGCGKRFWTTQHLRVHSELHKGEKPFKCTESSCEAAFLKHHQLRDHICAAHAPPGTKPYRCEHEGCDKSFTTNQKLRTHAKTHDEKRYTCVHATCMLTNNGSTNYFPTWTALQQHIRTAHPPACPHPDCKGKTFKVARGLKAHMKLHEQQAAEGNITGLESDADADIDQPPRKRRRGGELGRDWVCEVEGCGKDFKSKKALTNHHNVNHLGRRDFVCPHDECKRAFGYKHLLQRHMAKLHNPAPASESDDSDEGDAGEDEEDCPRSAPKRSTTIDDITGKNYATQANQRLSNALILQCPYPHLQTLLPSRDLTPGSSKQCEYVFSRAYDLRRHLRSEHNLETEKDTVDDWVKRSRQAKAASY